MSSLKIYQAAAGAQSWMLVANILHDSLQKATAVDVTPDNKLVITDVDKQVLQRVMLLPGNNCKVGTEELVDITEICSISS